ncbi:hypothetical protein [Luteipulveratus mongoliensis]|uniref:hypothetical protein n=1 Tax=Luteipulveratus mongoliensis TaxID=571913 RepID=UPI0006979210|nr:hypothetical protein [Luteipulveratus mongoliensis]
MRTLIGAAMAAAGLALAPMATASAVESGPSSHDTSTTQAKVNDVLKKYPGSRQVSSDKVAAKGFDVLVRPRDARAADLDCPYGNLCVTINGYQLNFYLCGNYPLDGWVGVGDYVNNQTPGTRATFNGQGGGALVDSIAYSTGSILWDPIWSINPC